MALSYQEATQQAVQLRKQGLTYPKIEEHLRTLGYVSPFTRKAVGHLTVRNMVVAAEKALETQDKKDETAETKETMLVSSPKQQTLDQIGKVCVMDFPVDLRIEMIRYLLANVR
jgi:hypothetical protein